MHDRTLLGVGIVGTVVTALRCATPILVVLLGAVGLRRSSGAACTSTSSCKA